MFSLTMNQITYNTIAVISLSRLIGASMEKSKPQLFLLTGDLASEKSTLKVDMFPLHFNGQFGTDGAFKEPVFKFLYLKERY